jgi:hypothetical protein
MSGYVFSTTLSADTSDYTASATARSLNDGRYDYYTGPDNVIRYSTDPTRAPAGLNGQPVNATIATPSLLEARQSENESSAVASLCVVDGAQVTYASGNRGNYGSISQLVAVGLLDNRFTQVTSGYVFSTTLSADTLDYTAYATARSLNDGRYDYYIRPDKVIRYSTDPTRAPAGLSGEPVR